MQNCASLLCLDELIYSQVFIPFPHHTIMDINYTAYRFIESQILLCSLVYWLLLSTSVKFCRSFCTDNYNIPDLMCGLQWCLSVYTLWCTVVKLQIEKVLLHQWTCHRQRTHTMINANHKTTTSTDVKTNTVVKIHCFFPLMKHNGFLYAKPSFIDYLYGQRKLLNPCSRGPNRRCGNWLNRAVV